MLFIISRTIVGATLLLIMPVSVWISGWTWLPGQYATGWLKSLYCVTETVTQPWGIITHGLLFSWFLWHLRFHLYQATMLFVILSSAILAGQGIKSLVKDYVQEIRPFIIWSEKTNHIPVDILYNLKQFSLDHMEKAQCGQDQDVPCFLRKQWQKETEFSFPSGHTIFATSWALLAISLLWPHRCTITVLVLLIWATGVMGSRLVLGMHRPRDLVVATLISWLLVTVATWLIHRFCNPLILLPKYK